MTPDAWLPLAGGADGLSGLLGPFLDRQAWARSSLGTSPSRVALRPVDVAVLRQGRPGLASVVVEAGEDPPTRLHVLLGWRETPQATAALARPGAVLGTGSDGSGEVLVYDALADPELCLELLEAASGGAEHAERARLVESLVSHASLVYDERLFMKCYRVIEPRPRPEIEMLAGLDRVGFNHILAPVARWSRDGGDLALVREFVPSAVEGRALALTSLRDLLARATPGQPTTSFEEVGRAGGDLGDEMRRLGHATAELHLALADAFGVREGGARVPGPRIRTHGDYHLRRVMRVDAGWLVAGFGDDPLIGAQAGAASQGEPRMGVPLEDVADLFISLEQVADEAALVQPPGTMAHARVLADGWVRHNRRSFLRGYLEIPGIGRLVPAGREEVDSIVASKVLDRRAAAG